MDEWSGAHDRVGADGAEPDAPRLIRSGPFTGRPVRAFTTDPVTARIRVAALAVTAATLAAVLLVYPFLPDTITTRVDVIGTPDGRGPKSSLLVLSALCAPLAAGMFALSRFPQYFNYPFPVTALNAQRLYRASEQMVVRLSAVFALVTAGITAGILVAPGFAIAALVVGVPATIATLAIGFTRLFRAA